MVAAIMIALLAVLWATGWFNVRGGDWTAGTNNTYCGIYWPRLDAYCEHAP